MAENPLLVDPAISRIKFERELAEYRAIEDEHLRRGWWVLYAEFPRLFIVFASPRLKPPAVIFGAILDFTNYDFWAPSVVLVNPFTREPYKAKELPTVMKRQRVIPAPAGIAAIAQIQGQEVQQIVSEEHLLQAHSPDDVPFLCVSGVREYHQHPGHTGDSWLLYRGTGRGTLFFVLDILYRYGVQPIDTYNVDMIPRIRFGESQVPE